MSFNEQKREQLNSRLKELSVEIDVLKTVVGDKQKELNLKIQTANNIQKEINSLCTNNETVISDHAYVRYFERVLGFDLQEIKQKILNERVKNMITTLGNTGKYPMDEFLLVIKDNTIVTIT